MEVTDYEHLGQNMRASQLGTVSQKTDGGYIARLNSEDSNFIGT